MVNVCIHVWYFQRRNLLDRPVTVLVVIIVLFLHDPAALLVVQAPNHAEWLVFVGRGLVSQSVRSARSEGLGHCE